MTAKLVRLSGVGRGHYTPRGRFGNQDTDLIMKSAK